MNKLVNMEMPLHIIYISCNIISKEVPNYMGFFLNNGEAYAIYRDVANEPYFVDKTEILADIFPLVDSTEKYICITRPRRFGRTIMANLAGAFFQKRANPELFLIP